MTRTLKAFIELDNLTFYAGNTVYALAVGAYHNDRAGVTVHGPEGPECKLTINLEDKPLAAGEFHAPPDSINNCINIFAALVGLGVIEPVDPRSEWGGRIVPYGPYDSHAELWRLSACAHKPVGFAAECAECTKRWRREYKAEDVSRRLDGGTPRR